MAAYNPDLTNWRGYLIPENVKIFLPTYTGNLTEKSLTDQIQAQYNLLNSISNHSSPEFAEANEVLGTLIAELQAPTGSLPNSSYGILWSPDPAAGWNAADQPLIDQLGVLLRIEYIPMPVEANIDSYFKEWYAARKPFISYYYSPEALLDPTSGVNMVRVQLEDWVEECQYTTDEFYAPCVYPTDNLVKALSVNLEKKSSQVYAFMQNFRHHLTSDVDTMIFDVTFNNLTLEQSACKYITTNYAYVSSMFTVPKNTTYLFYTEAPAIALSAVAALLIAITIAIMAFMNYHHTHPVVLASSLRFCNAILVGALLGYIAVFMFFGHPTVELCVFRPILLALSFGVMYSHLLVKNFRIWRIFKTPFSKSTSRLSDKNLSIFGMVVVAIEIVSTSLFFFQQKKTKQNKQANSIFLFPFCSSL